MNISAVLGLIVGLSDFTPGVSQTINFKTEKYSLSVPVEFDNTITAFSYDFYIDGTVNLTNNEPTSVSLNNLYVRYYCYHCSGFESLGFKNEEYPLYHSVDMSDVVFEWSDFIDGDGFYIESLMSIECIPESIGYSNSEFLQIEIITDNYNPIVNFGDEYVTGRYLWDYTNDVSARYGQEVYLEYKTRSRVSPSQISNLFDLIVDRSDTWTSGYTNGYNVGYNNGKTAGYGLGYTEGFDDGFIADGTAITIFNGILNVAMVPVNFFLSIFNFKILGINLKELVSALLTVAIIIIVIRLVTGKKE